MFGRLARWRQERIGGTVYLDCELAEGYGGLAPAREPKALPRLGPMVRGAPTTHWKQQSRVQPNGRPWFLTCALPNKGFAAGRSSDRRLGRTILPLRRHRLGVESAGRSRNAGENRKGDQG